MGQFGGVTRGGSLLSRRNMADNGRRNVRREYADDLPVALSYRAVDDGVEVKSE